MEQYQIQQGWHIHQELIIFQNPLYSKSLHVDVRISHHILPHQPYNHTNDHLVTLKYEMYYRISVFVHIPRKFTLKHL